jgi:predicted DNA-binding transcriptional regulator AlpA
MSPTEPPWRVVVEFVGVDLEDDTVVDALPEEAEHQIAWSSSEGFTIAEATVTATSAIDAVDAVIDAAASAAPTATVVRLIDPLVTVSDIAEDAGVSRQAVRNWATGARQSGFPRPLAIVGDGVRVWRHADVDRWLTAAVNLGTGHRFPTAAFIAKENERRAAESARHGDDTQHSEQEWLVVSDRSEHQATTIERPRRARAPGAARTRRHTSS